MMDSIRRALVVEDDRAWQEILAEVLGDCGLVVDVAGSLSLALPLLTGKSYRLLVADLSLSQGDHHNRDGIQLLDAVRESNPGCAAILLTGYATVELAVSALTEHGAFTCLRKETFNRRQFRELVGRALAGTNHSNGSSGSANQTASSRESGEDELALLTEREREVLELVARGLTNKEIAQELVITSNTVKRHLKAIFEKLDVHTRAGAAAIATRSRAG